jgi:hypothetical protein
MSLFIVNSDKKQKSAQKILSIFKENSSREKTIEPDMTPEEIADVISDKLMAIIKREVKILAD